MRIRPGLAAPWGLAAILALLSSPAFSQIDAPSPLDDGEAEVEAGPDDELAPVPDLPEQNERSRPRGKAPLKALPSGVLEPTPPAATSAYDPSRPPPKPI